MLEKIGLPAKPSLRGRNWVVDASHCQGCSSQFTFINRKHHCRRCGGLFCNNCTQQRMVLRGQGDSPVRICEPCKKQEEVARHEMRYGHRNRAIKGGSSKASSKNADEEVLNELLPSCSGKIVLQNEVTALNDEAGETIRSAGANESTITSHDERGHGTPEELRQQALKEKSRYKTLKEEGQSAEALKAFKRAKELERQAASEELRIRKERKRAMSSSGGTVQSQNSEDDSLEPIKKAQPSIPKKGKGKDDLSDELKSLGWSDVDLHDSDKKPAPVNLERELLNLMGNTSTRTDQKAANGVDKSEVIVLKKKALMLKRDGKLLEAKEELRKAKALEKQLEEQELLAGADDSDDEISALIRSMDDEKHDELSLGLDMNSGFKLDNLVGDGDDLGIESNFEVTDDGDMDDPSLLAALHSIGWTEEHDQEDHVVMPQPTSIRSREALQREILDLKKQALNQKHSGNVSMAMSLLKKAKLLEKDLEHADSGSDVLPELGTVVASDVDGAKGQITARKMTTSSVPKPASKSRLTIQRELLALKKKALALRKEGKVEEAEEELKKGKALEQQLEEIDNAPKTLSSEELHASTVLQPSFEEGDGDITEQDMHDPAYLTLLKSMGWEDEENEEARKSVSVESGKINASPAQIGDVVKKKRSKVEIQRELLGLRRKALALKRQGQASEAEEVLNEAKVLELLLEEKETSEEKQPITCISSSVVETGPGMKEAVFGTKFGTKEDVTEPPLPVESPPEANDSSAHRRDGFVSVVSHDSYPNQQCFSDDTNGSIQQKIINHKRKAVALKREGKLVEAREELRKAKLLENNALEEAGEKSQGIAITSISDKEVSTFSPTPIVKEPSTQEATPRPMSSQERLKLQRQCLNHKRNAMKLRREGRTEEAEAEYEFAKNLEAQLEEASGQQRPDSSAEDVLVGLSNDSGVEGILDPQVSAALKELNLPGIVHGGQSFEAGRAEACASKPGGKSEGSGQETAQNSESCSQERAQLEAQMKAERVKALQLKRSGNQAEALDALRKAKKLEKKLNSLLV